MSKNKSNELTKDLVKLGLAFTPLSNAISISDFVHKWILKKHVDRALFSLKWSIKKGR